MKLFNLVISLFFSALVLAGCGDNQKPKKYLQFMGGGLTFNYRYSKATMVVVVRRVSPIAEGGKFVCTLPVSD